MSPGWTGAASFSLRDVIPATKTSVPPLTVTTCECVLRTGKSSGWTIFFGRAIAASSQAHHLSLSRCPAPPSRVQAGQADGRRQGLKTARRAHPGAARSAGEVSGSLVATNWFQAGSNFRESSRRCTRYAISPTLGITRASLLMGTGTRVPRLSVNQEVAGSSPARGANIYRKEAPVNQTLPQLPAGVGGVARGRGGGVPAGGGVAVQGVSVQEPVLGVEVRENTRMQNEKPRLGAASLTGNLRNFGRGLDREGQGRDSRASGAGAARPEGCLDHGWPHRLPSRRGHQRVHRDCACALKARPGGTSSCAPVYPGTALLAAL